MGKEYLKGLFRKFISAEDEAYAMYKNFAAISKSPVLKELFLALAEEELGHKRLFEEMEPAKVVNNNAEKIEKIKFDGIGKQLMTDNELKEFVKSLDLAIMLEQKSHEEYKKLAAFMNEGEEKLAVLEVAKQELKHKEKLILVKEVLLK